MGLLYEARFYLQWGSATFLKDNTPPPEKGSNRDPKNSILIFFVSVKIKEIFALGKKYPWPRPAVCPRCKDSRVWGHGFVPAYFDGFVESVLLRRYRCPGCGCVMRLRPKEYFARFQAPIETIRFCLSHRLNRGRWPPGRSRSRQRHWLRALRRKTMAYLGKTWHQGLMTAFDWLLQQAVIPVSRGI